MLKISDFNLLSKYSGQHFDKLLIENSSIQSIEDESLSKISFDEIEIINYKRLKRIHRNAFGKQSVSIKRFIAWNGIPCLESEIPSSQSNYDLTQLINSLSNCEEIVMMPYQHEVPQLKLSKLKKLSLNGHGSPIKIKSINDHVLYHCDELEEVDLRKNSIDFIIENAFRFKNPHSDKILEIDLYNNNLNENSFSCLSTERPVILWLNDNHIKYLKENSFKPFFDSNQRNYVWFAKNHIDLTAQQNRWIYDGYETRIHRF